MTFKNILKVLVQERLQHTANFVQNIEIPFKINRSSTDLLKALASTIKKDYTAPEYKFHDDPFFIPVNKNEKRSFALSKESGRMAARYFLDKYPTLFEDFKDFPKIESFYSKNPQLEEALKMKPSEGKLKSLVDLEANLDIIFKVYKEIKDEGISIEHGTKLLLLQLFAFNNSSDPGIHDLGEESSGHDIQMKPGDDMYWFKGATGLKPYKARWKDMGYADQLWEDVENKDALAYSIMIRGLAKYMSTAKAKSLYEDMKANDIKRDHHIYNAMLELIPYQADNAELQWIWAKSYMSEMAQDGILPTLGTFNAALKITSRIRNFKFSAQLSLQILAEMKACYIEPSLGTFELILKGHYRERRSHHTIIYDIVDYLKDKEFTIQHSNDINFFTTAMYVCRANMEDKALAHQLVEIYEYGNNRLLIGDHDNHHQFFSTYFRVIAQHDNVESVIHAYNKYVPNEFCVDMGMGKELLRFVSRNLKTEHTEDETESCLTNGGDLKALLDYIPRLWSDFKTFAIIIVNTSHVARKDEDKQRGNTRDLEYFKEFLHVMVSALKAMKGIRLNDEGNDTLTETKARFGSIALEVIRHISGEGDRSSKYSVQSESKKSLDSTGASQSIEESITGIFNDIVVVLYHAQLYEDIWPLLRRFQQSDIITELSPNIMENLVKTTISNSDIIHTMLCFKVSCQAMTSNTPQLHKLILSASNETEQNISPLILGDNDRSLLDNWLEDYETKKKLAKEETVAKTDHENQI